MKGVSTMKGKLCNYHIKTRTRIIKKVKTSAENTLNSLEENFSSDLSVDLISVIETGLKQIFL